MENASKALMIAGGVLIALIIITMFLMMYNRLSSLQNEQEERAKLEQISAFNAEFEAYDKKVMYGADVITLLNKVTQNNINYNNNSEYKITTKVTVKEGATETEIIDGTGNELLAISDTELMVFKCTKMEYNSLGRICNIEIITK